MLVSRERFIFYHPQLELFSAIVLAPLLSGHLF